jgi:hypothetical protein
MKASTRHVLSLTVGLVVAALSRHASAWVDAKVAGDNVRIDLERGGSAVVEHTITLKVQGGPLRSFDIPGVDGDAEPLPDSSVEEVPKERPSAEPPRKRPSAKDVPPAAPMPLTALLRPDSALRVSIDNPKGVSRGVFLFRVRYRTHLPTGDRIQREGAMLRVTWRGPSWPEGIDNARCTFVVPSAPTEARTERDPSLAGAGPAEDVGAFLATVRRGTDHDEVELVRPHVARAEAVGWTLRVDPRALGRAEDALASGSADATSAGPLAASPPERDRGPTALYAALIVLFSAAVGIKAHHVGVASAGRGVRPRPLVPVGTALRTLLSGPALAAGVALELALDDPLWGALSVLVAMALSSYLPPKWRPVPRGPGQWLPLREAEAFAPRAPAAPTWLDAGTGPGRIVLLALSLVAGAAAWIVSRHSLYEAQLVVFDALAAVPVLITGRLRDLPPDPFASPARPLQNIASALRRSGLRVVAWARLPHGSERFDELRLFVAPRLPRRGFTGIEIGYVIARGIGGSVLLPEVLVRAVDASPCHDAIAALLRGSRWMRGRRPDERVALVRPRLPTVQMTTALARRLAEAARETPRSTRAETPRSALPQAARTARAAA